MPLRHLSRAIVWFAAWLGPSGCRADLRAEWEAELTWAERDAAPARSRRRRDAALLRRSLGAVFHALWLRKEQWSLDMLWQDIKYAVRVLAGRPSFTLVAILTLALGIGANVAIFSIVYGVLLKPLPFANPDRLVHLWETNPLRNWTNATASPANLIDWRRRNRVFEGIAFYPGMDNKTPIYVNGTLTGVNAEPERLRGLQVSTNLFDVLGVAAAVGRGFAPEDEEPEAGRVAILGNAAWRTHFRADPAVVGRVIVINTRPYRVIGIMPADFRFPSPDVDLYTPFVLGPDMQQVRRPHYLRPIARLKAGVTLAQAREDLRRIASELEREYPDTNTKMGADLGRPVRTLRICCSRGASGAHGSWQSGARSAERAGGSSVNS